MSNLDPTTLSVLPTAISEAVRSQPSSNPNDTRITSPPMGNGHTMTGNSSALTTGPGHTPDVDPQIIEALKSKDRIYVLKLGETMENIINEAKLRTEVSPATSYQRLLVHRCTAYYRLQPETDPISKNISILLTAESRIPARRIGDLVPPEAFTQPSIKIMRRTSQDRRPKPRSQAGSVTGEEADSSDLESAEANSNGGKSNGNGAGKKHMTIAEREAAYNEARSRIFMDFEEKDKDSTNSSTLSLTSGSSSTSNGGGSSCGEVDDSASSLATESEWSGPTYSRDKKRFGGNGNQRSMRTSAPSFTSSSSTSSRNSRASSPSYVTNLHDQSLASAYDYSHHAHSVPIPYGPYAYPYAHMGQAAPPANPYMGPPYGYYAPYPVYSQSQQSGMVDGSSPVEVYHTSAPMPYNTSYMPPQRGQQAPSNHSIPIQNPSSVPGQNLHPNPPLNPQVPPYQYQPYHPPVYAYPMPGYYTPQPNQPMVSPPIMNPPIHSEPSTGPHSKNGNYMHTRNQNEPIYNGNGRDLDGRGNMKQQSLDNNNLKMRHAPQVRPAPWSFGPGIGSGGVMYANNIHHSSPKDGGDSVGPRMNSIRRFSSNSNSSNNHNSNGDEASSTTSSSTASSSSMRTFTSTSSSQHPLPPRPDWAVGLKPEPTLHGSHNRHHEQRGMSTGQRHVHTNAAQPSRQQGPGFSPVASHSMDFPPLSNAEKRPPTIAGAWVNSSAKSIFTPHDPQEGVSEDGSSTIYDTRTNGIHSQTNCAVDTVLNTSGTPAQEGDYNHMLDMRVGRMSLNDSSGATDSQIAAGDGSPATDRTVQ